ncbi:hypothetical protein NK6_608 [Bradyrhizobium diazoefficiens]|uniref:Uncharacterized protein n=1 Tax=Bradyrhizobium diazoefficiens TaxID=1355477 RepID=A0A0E4FQD0_9BRAD|nr:hypothetical protein NK6_608 [Bradyrhizobium diazoefficiens]
MTRQPPRQGAGSRHKSSGSLLRHWRHFFRFDDPYRHMAPAHGVECRFCQLRTC